MHATRRVIAAVATAAALGLGLGACAGGTAASDEPSLRTHEEVTVYTWWASGVEKQGLDKLAEVFERQHPGIRFMNDGVMGGGGSSTSKEYLQTRLETQDPPDTFAAHAGAELQDYIEDGHIQDLRELYKELKLKDVFPPKLMDRLTAPDGGIYSVPSNIHRANLLWANPEVLRKAGIDPAARYGDFDTFIADLEKLKQAGVQYPLSVGTEWPQVHLFEAVLLGDLGHEAYQGLWAGTTDWNGPEVTAALEHYKTLLGYTNPDRNELEWDKASEMVLNGTSGFNIMGDWAMPVYAADGRTYGKDFVVVPSPGTDGVFDFLADSFTMSSGILDEESTKAWLATVSSKEGQLEFNRIKGSIPARTDVDPGQFTEYQKTAMQSFTKDEIVSSVTHGAAVPVAQLTKITAAVTQFEKDGNVPALQAGLAASAG